MGHWARIDENNIVQEVLVITEDMLKIENYYGHDKSKWIKTSYNTLDGKHYVPKDHQDWSEESTDQSKALRFRYAGKGYVYDATNDVFYPPQPYSSWTLNTTTWLWDAPIDEPSQMTENGIVEWEWDEDAYQADTGNPKTQGWVQGRVLGS